MTANELRIGNLVKCKTSNDAGIYTVRAIDGINLKIYLNSPRNVWHTEDKIKPIPLTEEWLLKFGFETRIDSEGFFFKGITFYKGFLTDNQKNKIEFVYQLQNLYFALTGEELTLNN